MTTKLTLPVIAIAGTALLSACTSQPKAAPGLSERFITDVSANDRRHFSYELSMQSGKGNGRYKPKGRNSKKGQGRKAGRHGDLEKLAAYRLDKALQETGYCRKGYFVIAKDVDRNKIEIKGECRS